MSGIEIAGLVLGAFPVAIEVIKVYSNAMKKIHDIKNYQQILRQFARQLKVEKCKFTNSFLELLEELASPAKIKRMMADLQCDEWDDEDFRSQLKGRLRPADETLDNWLGTANELNENLKTVIERFKLPQRSIQQSIWRRPPVSAKFDPRSAWEVATLSSYRTEQIDQIRQLNVDLRELADGGRKSISEPSSPNTPTINNTLITYHRRIHHYASLLYSTLSEKLGPAMCTCGSPHSAHLELKMRGRTPPTKVPAPSSSQTDIHCPNQFLTFSLMFLTQENGHEFTPMWQEFQLEPRDSRDSNLNAKSLACPQVTPPSEKIALSSSNNLAASSSPERGRPVSNSSNRTKGFLFPPLTKLKDQFSRTTRSPSPNPVQDNSPSRQCPVPKKKRARFSDDDGSGEDDGVNNIPLHVPTVKQVPTIPSFCTTLATNHPNTPPQCIGLLISKDKNEHLVWTPLRRISPQPARLVSLADLIATFVNKDTPSRTNRLVLGLKLISSVLQLNSTQWLTEKWEARDILFPEADQNILSHPFVHRNFKNYSAAPPDSQEPANQATKVIGCNQSLYSLGIVLLEVWHWQTFSSLHSSSASGLSEMLFAQELSEKLFEEAGEQYAMAVRRCIRGFEMKGTDLQEDSLRDKAYQGIFRPLEAHLRTFSGKDFQKIITEG